MPPAHIDDLVRILSDQAASHPKHTPQDYLRDLVSRAHLPPRWAKSLAGVYSGDANVDARRLIDWALKKDIHPKDKTATTIGALIRPLLEDLGAGDDRATVIAIVHADMLFRGKTADSLAMAYQVPLPVETDDETGANHGPEINWRGPTNDVEYQALFRSEPELMDVGFLTRMISRSSAVCRVELAKQACGTGFLVAPDLVLTNHHVLEGADDDSFEENIRNTVLRFGRFTMADGSEAGGHAFKLADEEPVLASSVKEKLDYVLLRVNESILENEDLSPAPLNTTNPIEKTALHILQHPGGDAMKVAFSENGVSGVYPDSGLLQYVTRARSGSSGSPCFNDNWEVTALHHAQRSKSFGTVREGILILNILNDMKVKGQEIL